MSGRKDIWRALAMLPAPDVSGRWFFDKESAYYSGWNDALGKVITMLPTYVDELVDRKTGKWVECGDNQPYSCDTVYCCSSCGKGRWLYNFPHYCPNCGAEMEVDNAQVCSGRRCD